MKQVISKALAPLTLLEWGAIMVYFYFSGRIVAFLHPTFRPMVLAVGILMILSALVLVVWREDSCCSDHSDCGHSHSSFDEPHAHREALTFGGFCSFLVLLLPIALATQISTDTFGVNLLKNRGALENAQSLPGASARLASLQKKEARSSKAPVAPTPTPQPVYVGVDSEFALPTQNGEPAQNSDSTTGYQNPALIPNKDGAIKVEAIDLIFVAGDASARHDFDGKLVEMIGQYSAPAKGTKGSSFKLVRMFMVCCAADVQPVMLGVRTEQPMNGFAPMDWVKVVGKVQFGSIGDKPAPCIVHAKITHIPAPDEPYVY